MGPLMIPPEEITVEEVTYWWVPRAHESDLIETVLRLADHFADENRPPRFRAAVFTQARLLIASVYSPFDSVLKQRFNDRLNEKTGEARSLATH